MSQPESRELSPGDTDVLAAAAAMPGSVIAGTKAGPPTVAISSVDPLRKVSRSYITWLMLANFGTSMALLVPLAYSLAVRVNQLAPGHEEVQGYIIGVAALAYIIASPLLGLWSDRTRTRLGRRRPFVLGGVGIGLVGLVVMAVAPSVLLLGVGWLVASLGWNTAQVAVQNVQADRLPDEQRGKVAGLVGMTSQIAPIIGIGFAYTVKSNMILLFLVPGLIGLALTLFYVLRDKEDSRGFPRMEAVHLRNVLRAYGFNIRKYPSFAWNWLGRFVFFVGLYFNTTFGTFFYAQRLGLPIGDVAGVVALIGMFGVVAAVAGSVGVGFLSDRFRRRKVFIGIGVVFFLAGAGVEAFAFSLPLLVIGAVIMQIALASFATVDQAIVITVLPERAEAARYMAIIGLAQKIPSGIAPIIASGIIAIGVSGADKNYTLLYLVGGAMAFIGGLLIMTKVRGVR